MTRAFAAWARLRTLPWALEAALARRNARARRLRIGWVTVHTLDPAWPRQYLGHLGGALDMRVSNNARWLNQTAADAWNEIYRPGRRYDLVVFFKAMDERCQREARRLAAEGVRLVFDANVNYYEIWGEYDIPGTRPTEQQQADAIAMTSLADWVVADSSHIAGVAARFNPRVSFVPDNVNLGVFRGRRRQAAEGPVRLVWSGVSHKAQELEDISRVLSRLKGVELVVVSDARPAGLTRLGDVVPTRFVRYSDRSYARTLLGCDVIISPRRLNNAYALGHSEYKITLGMALGLPAVASRQQSYVEAISWAGGGMLATSPAEWRDALESLVGDHRLRDDLGERAARTVAERYATPVVAAQFERVLRGLL